MNTLEKIAIEISRNPKTWLVTGCAGFIGSHLLEFLLAADQKVVGLDNFSTGFKENIESVLTKLSPEKAKNFNFIEGDITNLDTCIKASKDVDFVLHQAALGSVPRSILNPIDTHKNNVDGTINMFWACVVNDVKKIVFASSSSVYGDSLELPKKEETIGNPLSPYAATKAMAEIYAHVFCKNYPKFRFVGLRYFNVFGPRQNPDGPYAAVIPRWQRAIANGEPIEIFGDGTTSRDFTYVSNVVQLNVLAATSSNSDSENQIYNGALGNTTSLNMLADYLEQKFSNDSKSIRKYSDFRPGDIKDSLADIGKARELLLYSPNVSIKEGIEKLG